MPGQVGLLFGHDGYPASDHDLGVEVPPEISAEVGSAVVVAMHITAKGRRTAIAVEQRTAAVWTICDGKVIGVLAYASLPEAFDAMGLAQ